MPTRLTLLGPLPPYRGGIAHFNTALARELRSRGHDVDLITFRRQYPRLLFPGKSQEEPGYVSAEPDYAGSGPGQLPEGFRESEAPARILNPLNPLSWHRAVARVEANGSDAAILPYWMPFFAPMTASLAKRLGQAGIPMVSIVHNAISHERRPAEAFLAGRALRACSGLLVLSDSVRDDLERLAPEVPTAQASHPVYDQFGEAMPKHEARALLGLPAIAPAILFFGFVRRYKGLGVLLDAMPEIVASLPNLRLVVAGEFYEGEEALRNKASRLGDAVRFDAEYIPNERVAAYFSAADLVVQPYVRATQSGVAAMAFQFGRPVLTTNVGGLAETVGDGNAGLVVPPEDPGALAAAIVRFFRQNLEDALAAGAREQKERRSWGAVVEALERLMANALEEGDRSQ